MAIHTSQVLIVTIDATNDLDMITVYLEDLGVNSNGSNTGMITIACFGKAWSHYFHGMGNRNMAQFFCDCNQHYLAGKLSDINPTLHDFDKLESVLWNSLRNQADKLSTEIYEDLQYQLETYDSNGGIHWCNNHYNLMQWLVAYDWYEELPEKENPEYTYLLMIIQSVQSGLKEYLDNQAI